MLYGMRVASLSPGVPSATFCRCRILAISPAMLVGSSTETALGVAWMMAMRLPSCGTALVMAASCWSSSFSLALAASSLP